MSFGSLIAEASARIHATRAVFLVTLTSYMLSLVVDRDHAKGAWWITVLVGKVSATPVTPQSRRRFSSETADGHVVWVDARLVFHVQVVGAARMTNAVKQNASRDFLRFAVSITGTQEVAKEIRRTKDTNSKMWECRHVTLQHGSPPDPFLDASILLVKGIDSVADGHVIMATLVKTHDTKSQPTNKLLQRVLNKSHVHHPMFKFSTCSVGRDCAVERAKHKCYWCNM